MSNPDIRYNLDLLDGIADRNEFARVIRAVRTIRPSRIRGGMLLEDINLFNVDLFYEGRTIRLKTSGMDLDLIGYVKIGSEDILWELRSDGDFQYLAGSYPSVVSVNSVNSGEGASDRDIGYMAMNNAFNTLWFSHPQNRDDIESALQTIRLMLCETAKFHLSFVEVYRNIERKRSVRVPDWMMTLANNWENISQVAKLPLPRHMQFPEELDPEDREMYNNHNLDVFDPRITPSAPYFARLLLCVIHIER